MPKRTDRSILIDDLLKIIANKSLNSAGIFDDPAVQKLAKKWGEQKLRAALRYATYNQLVFRHNNGSLSVTNKAKKRLESIDFEHIIVPKPKKWDGKWRLVMFEIPGDMKTQRDAFVNKISSLGFKKLQDSVYIYPYPSEPEILQICDFYKITKHVIYIDKSKLSDDAKLKKAFNL